MMRTPRLHTHVGTNSLLLLMATSRKNYEAVRSHMSRRPTAQDSTFSASRTATTKNQPKLPCHQIGRNLLGSFPASSPGNRWIGVQRSTQHCEIKAFPKATAADAALFFVHSILLRQEVPAVVITYHGTAFTAEMLQEVLRISGTAHRTTTVYHPKQMD